MATSTELIRSIQIVAVRLAALTEADLEPFNDDLKQVDEDLHAIADELNLED